MNAWKETVLRRFDAAAGTYDEATGLQRRVAAALARQVLSLPPPPAPDVLEVGCGTGILTGELAPRLPGCRWLATDLAPGMVEACARRTGDGVALRVMDGEFPDLPEARFDLVVSNLAVQWFEDPAAGIRRLHRLLRPGGALAATTLGAGTFPEWRRTCRRAGAAPGMPPYPRGPALAAALGPDCSVRSRAFPLRCEDLKGFLDHLRLTGARTPAPGHPGLAPGALGRILRAAGGAPFTATYQVLTVVWGR
ncbi:MAG: methyltransferase domain-containing protein [Holophaga sp.]